MRIEELDTPALLIDREILESNLQWMQDYANRNHVALRPHTKTHKMPAIARRQMDLGACGIAVAKVGEAEVMAEQGLRDILIANEIVGQRKFQRIAALRRAGCTVSFGGGSPSPCRGGEAEAVFAAANVQIPVLIEIEVGENRSGIIEECDFWRCWTPSVPVPTCCSAGFSPTTETAIPLRIWTPAGRSPGPPSAGRWHLRIWLRPMVCPAAP
mgnify:CR=1 FL=1